ncbi:hypothetical protein HYC85_025160 [Camellia sinensis]|uniref:PHD-type domain-containing protein n=1 Tax=Camellia sinensis TaxID=4442 RepID=A0A7J7GE09_CAMSI|nr:hypothetical protein HYC85_025160 [Camellia sinensis]
MEPAVIRLERRGRKRKRKDVENVLAGPQPNKQVVEIRSMVLVGRYVKKEFEGSGNFFGKIVYYDTGLYRIDYEDGDCEDLESAEVRKLLIRDGDLVGDLINKLDELLAKKYAKGKDIVDGKVKDLVNVADRVKASLPNELSNDGDNEIDVQIDDDDDADSSSDSCEHTWDHYFSSEADAPFVPPPQLPPSSGNIGVPEECVSHLFSVYGFLRSFSIQLFLSPFGLDDFVGSLNCLVPNTLLDGIHVALMHMLRRHLDMLSYDGSELASKCLRFTDWSLLDTLTWPVYLVQYLMVMGYTNGPEWKGFYIDVLEKDYYTLPAGRKLMILLILCDDVVESIELRTEIDTCEESIVGIDSDAVVSESGPRRVHPRYSKTSACKNEEAMEIIAKVHGTKSTCNSSYLGVKGTEMNVDADIVYDGNGDECRLCGMDGTLLCCDGCPSAYHSRCIGVSKMFIPEGAWYCPECTINKIGPKIMRGTPLRGAEIFGIDSYGQVFLGTCNHLLVLKDSIKSEPYLQGNYTILEYSKRYTSGNSNGSHRGYVDVNVSSQSKEGNVGSAGRGYRNSSDDCFYMGSHFKSQAYINNYVHGDFAASAAVNLAILSTEESRVSESHSDNRRKLVSANTSLQVKAFSSAAIRFFWPNSEKKLVEVPRERCSWCLSCRAPVTSKKACLLNGAASNAIKGAMKILAGLRPTKNGDGSLLGIATYVMLMEESLCGLTIGPFQSAAYRKQWRKQVEQATTCSAVKSLLLELEENIRSVALSGDWVKLVDNWSVESFVTQSATFATGTTQKRGPGGRRGRKPSVISEVTSDDSIDNLSDFNWWRGGILSKLILHRGVLPRSMVKKAARQGGRRKIPGIYYAEGSEIPKRSRQYFWRAAVEMSKNASQLALQVRYLDLHVRWSDLVCPEQNLQDGKGPETEASAFRNAFVCDKKNVEHMIIYGVAFENQKHLPSRVMKNIIEVEQRQDGREKYWFSETHIPLYLIKEYEQDIGKSLLPLAGKPANVLSKLQRRQLKASRKDIFSYLSCKRDNLDKCHCASCQLDVLLGNAVRCSECQGFCHEDCTISSTIQRIGEVEFLITCKRCSPTKTIPKSENSNESSTRPLLLQGQEFQNAVTVSKGAKQKSFIQPSTPVGHLGSFLKIKSAPRGSSLAAKNRHRLCSWGLIWKKKNLEDNGIDFRLKNLLLRGNSDMSWPGPPYNSDLMYIRCETCKNWYHADAVELEESRIFDLMGFKCCRCRRIRTPVCPYMDLENKRILEAKKPRTRAPKAGNSESDPDYGTISEQAQELESAPPMLPKNEAKRTFSRAPNSESDPGYGIVSEQSKELESAPPGLPNNEEAVRVKEDNPLSSISMAEQFTKLKSEIDVEGNAVTATATASGTGPRKLTVRRHIQNENNVDGTSANNLSQVELSTLVEPNHVLIPAEGLCPRVTSDVSKSFEDGMLFDHEGLSYEDMEFEPQTYFSFTELLASDDVMGDWQSLSAVSSNGFPEPCGIRASNQQEHKISVKPRC